MPQPLSSVGSQLQVESSRAAEHAHNLSQHTIRDVCMDQYPHVPFNWRSQRKVLALTFDDGPEASGLNPVLDVLARHGIKATFFWNTPNLQPGAAPAHKAAAVRAVQQGHDIGSHAAQHLDLTKLQPDQIDQQIAWGVGNISSLTDGSTVPLFRAPYGAGFWSADKAASSTVAHLWSAVRKQHIHVSWTIDGKDFAVGGNKDKCGELFNVYGPPTVQQGLSGVVLMHAAPWGIGMCPDTLDRLVQYWKEAGYTFSTVAGIVHEIYGMPPAAVVERAQQCP
ncbi:hypothetical protein OEZ85_001903 [Tetradesmus obliquus]|uniref:NodB homology domain-containing protein n=1 Tax=Tetradesmus obliquus TaxID=3088 RepID=A0ABY8U434_TETOB|nr:hypothetical protein OEZ85_001903 [Tetradesmus obliquus]